MPGYSEESRQRVIKALEEGHGPSQRKIADYLHVSKSLAQKIMTDLKKTRSPEVSEPEHETTVTTPPLLAPGDQPLNPDSSVEEMLIPRGSKKRGTTLDDPRDREIEMLKARVIALTNAMQSAYGAAARGSVAGDSVAGRPSLASFREETWRKFAGTVIDLPNTALRLGRERTLEIVMGTLLADLAVLALGPPPTPQIAIYRSSTEHLISDRAKLAVLIGNDPAGRRLRMLLLQSAVKYYFAPSVQRLFEKSIETLLPGDFMGGQEG